jgi:hypothetical protein
VDQSQGEGLPGRQGVTAPPAVIREEPRLAAAEAIVVGAGVSGCACAAALASRGVRVTVLNSALDAVGLPGYGPDVAGKMGGWAEIGETMAALPAVLREVWLDAVAAPDDGAAFLTVDRRMVSIETKRALERIPGLEFRQGLVTDVRVVPEGGHRPGPEGSPSRGGGGPGRARVAVETVFGEVIEADAVVLAVGLSLGGRVAVGDDVMPGGRYGETPADGLREALQALGVTYGEATVEVGARFASSNSEVTDFIKGSRGRRNRRDRQGDPGSSSGQERRYGRLAARAIPVRAILAGAEESPATGEPTGFGEPPGPGGVFSGGRQARLKEARRALGAGSDAGERSSQPWPLDCPPAPHWTDGLRIDQLVLRKTEQGKTLPLLSPDGLATAEVHLSPEGARSEGLDGVGNDDTGCELHAMASRLGHTVRGLTIENLSPKGRLAVGEAATLPVWVAGRTAGAAGYLESLRSGIRAAQDVATFLAAGSAHTLDGPAASPGGSVAGAHVRDRRDVPREFR